MAMIKTDPSQTKAVVVLLIVLGGAIVFTVARIHPDAGQPGTAAATTAAVAQASSGCVTVIPAFEASRNPFRRPDGIRAAVGKSTRGVGEIGVQGVVARPSGSFGLDAMPVAGLSVSRTEPPESAVSEQDQATAKTEAAKPEFTLLATVGGPNGMCAVIRSGESSTRVVAVGDIVEGGYKVRQIEKNRAVLGNGVDTVVVKRPG